MKHVLLLTIFDLFLFLTCCSGEKGKIVVTFNKNQKEGIDPYKPDSSTPPKIEGMNLVWNDEFNVDGKPDPKYWNYEIGFVRNKEPQWYTPDNANVKNGVLLIEAKKEEKPNPNYVKDSDNWKQNRKNIEYTSASINTRGKIDWLFGRFDIRARIDTTVGSWPAIWTLGTKGKWPASGEIDIMEFYRLGKNKQTPTILANVATQGEKNTKWFSQKSPLSYFIDKDKNWVDKFHVWRMDWDEVTINLYLDNELLNTVFLNEAVNFDGTVPFWSPQYILLNFALRDNDGGDLTSTKFPRKYEVDYVRIYQKTSTPAVVK